MFDPEAILYEDNHLLVVNKQAGQLVQPDPSGDTALEEEIKAYLKVRDQKPGNVFLGVVHRIDRPVSGAVLFAKTGKALVRMNEEVKNREIKKIYWALTENRPQQDEGELIHFLVRDGKTNRSRVYDRPTTSSPTPIPGSCTEHPLLSVRDRSGDGAPPPDPSTTHQDRMSHSWGSKVWSPAVESRREHFAACPEHRIHPPRTQRADVHHGTGTSPRQPLAICRKRRNGKLPIILFIPILCSHTRRTGSFHSCQSTTGSHNIPSVTPSVRIVPCDFE